jgi:aspartate carbamoyltransferase catalytic subunit
MSSQMDEIFHITESQQFSRNDLDELFNQADAMETLVKHRGVTDTLKDKVMVVLFYQPSTRTRLSFETAMSRLGGSYVSTENAMEFSSHAKGESLEDTIQTVANYGDVIILRYHKEGGAKRAARVSPVPVINAGDGPGQHPTQSLLDMYTIRREFGSFEGLNIALVGDLKNGRTVHSLAYMLAKYPIGKICLVAPPSISMPQGLLDYLEKHGIDYNQSDSLAAVAPHADVVYSTRLQKEYFDDPREFEAVQGKYVLSQDIVDTMREKSIILHPLPRNEEIPYVVDHDPRARYFPQVRNGLYMRMALLNKVFGR